MLAAFAVVTAAPSAAAFVDAGSASAGRADTVVIGHEQAPATLNGVLLAGNSVVTHQVTAPVVGENMLTLTPALRYRPVLATAVPSRAAGTLTTNPHTVTFTIRPRAAWSDRVPVSADDVIFTWKTIMNPRNRVSGRTGWDRVRRIERLGPKRFRVVFRTPYAAWRDLFSPSGGSTSQLLPRHALVGRDFNRVWNRGGILGTGPFVLESYLPGRRAVLVANRDYWNRGGSGGPHLERIVHVFLPPGASVLEALRRRMVDLVNPIDFTTQPALRRLRGVTVSSRPGLTWEHLSFNASDPVLADARVRRAVAFAIDRPAIVAAIGPALVRPLESFLLPEQRPHFTPAWSGYGPDPARVEQELTAAGYARDADGVWARGGLPLSLELATISGNPVRRRNLELIGEQLARVGIRTTLRFTRDFFEADGPLFSGRYQIAEFAFSRLSDPSVTSLLRSSQVPTAANNRNGQNTYFVSDPVLDDLLDASDRELDVGARAMLMRRIQQRVAEQAYLLPLYQRPQVLAYRSDLLGVLNNPSPVGLTDQTQGWRLVGARAGG